MAKKKKIKDAFLKKQLESNLKKINSNQLHNSISRIPNVITKHGLINIENNYSNHNNEYRKQIWIDFDQIDPNYLRDAKSLSFYLFIDISERDNPVVDFQNTWENCFNSNSVRITQTKSSGDSRYWLINVFLQNEGIDQNAKNRLETASNQITGDNIIFPSAPDETTVDFGATLPPQPITRLSTTETLIGVHDIIHVYGAKIILSETYIDLGEAREGFRKSFFKSLNVSGTPEGNTTSSS